MLVIRMQRTGRSGHAQFRVVVQDSRTAPSSGKVVARLGSYDPHTKTTTLDKEKAELYLKNGARPSDRAAGLLKSEKVKLPEWFSFSPEKKSALKNTDKLRRNRPTEEVESEKSKVESSEPEAPAETPPEAPAEPNAETPTEESTPEEAPAEPETPQEETPVEDEQKA